jgi:hypothetical protein
MADIKVKVMHPTDGRVVDVNVDEAMTAQEMVSELVSNNFITANPQGYNLAIKGGNQLTAEQSLRDAGVTDGTVLRVIPATDAGRG